AEVALWLGDAASAEIELDRAQPQEPVAENELRVRIDLALGRFDAALQRLAGEVPGIAAPQARLYRGQALQGLGNHEQALAEFEAAAEQAPQLLAAQVGIVESLTALARRNEASVLAQRMVQEHPQAALSWY